MNAPVVLAYLQPVQPQATWEHPRIPLRRLDSYLREAGLL